MAIVSFEDWGGQKVAHLNAMAGGNLKLWKFHFSDLADWCAMHGAESISYTGPKAYSRLFPDTKVSSTNFTVGIKK